MKSELILYTQVLSPPPAIPKRVVAIDKLDYVSLTSKQTELTKRLLLDPLRPNTARADFCDQTVHIFHRPSLCFLPT